MTVPKIVIDPEFKALIPALQDDEYKQLEAAILADGCRDALVIWKGENILVDGHNRYAICTEHGIEFQTIERDFEDRDAVTIWMINNQFARRNISMFLRGELALKLKSVFEKRARDNQLSGLKQGDKTPVSLNSTKREKVDTRKELAKKAETSEDTIRKVEKVTEQAPDEIKEQARQQEISVNKAYELTKLLEKLPERNRARVYELCGDDKDAIKKMASLYKSSGSIESNGTYYEIIDNGGFHYGDEMKLWLDWKKSSNTQRQKALNELAEYHKQIARDKRNYEIAQAGLEADLATQNNDAPIIEITYKHGDIVQVGDHILLCADNTSDIAKQTIKGLDKKPSLIFCDPPYNADSAEYDNGTFEWSHDYFSEVGDIVAVTPGISSIQSFMKRTNMPYQWSTSAYISNGMTRGAIGFGNWIYTAIFSHGSIYRNRQDVYQVTINGKQLESGDKKQKPSHYLSWLFQLFAKKGDWVVDAFGGSGNSVIVAHEQGFKCLSIEKDPDTFKQMVANIKEYIEPSMIEAAA